MIIFFGLITLGPLKWDSVRLFHFKSIVVAYMGKIMKIVSLSK